MKRVIQQIKERRKKLAMTQGELASRIGMTRQSYQRSEGASGNPRLDTLDLVAKALDAEIMLIPLDKSPEVKRIVDGDFSVMDEVTTPSSPWDKLLKDD